MSNKNAQSPQEKIDSGFDESYAKSEFTFNPLKESNDPYAVPGKNPHRAYKWISFNEFIKNGYRDFRGWCALTKETLTTEKFKLDSGHGDGFAHKGSTILAFMPLSIYQKLQEQKRQLIRNTSQNIKNAPKRAADELSRKGYGKNLLTVEDVESTTQM